MLPSRLRRSQVDFVAISSRSGSSRVESRRSRHRIRNSCLAAIHRRSLWSKKLAARRRRASLSVGRNRAVAHAVAFQKSARRMRATAIDAHPARVVIPDLEPRRLSRRRLRSVFVRRELKCLEVLGTDAAVFRRGRAIGIAQAARPWRSACAPLAGGAVRA